MNPFIVLHLPIQCTDEQVKAAYQQLLRKYPPETAPEAFQLIHESYEALRTERLRMRAHYLRKDLEAPSLQALLEDYSRLPGRLRPPGESALQNLFQHCATAAKRDAKSAASTSGPKKHHKS